ncbi:hypothetical protein KP509_07G029900 [Ceratopteris richardii]|uniref:Uncharacterized protein n=1 Tax=Ceratopteris richardii TaxID=49495 RepID=A0A8T2UB18_CERRI|nr:hypothetical protein KP509_07G029900 [Ceratopteris richardii]
MQGELQQWTGYWMYGSYKGPTDLQLFVAYDHQVLGSGEDEVGKFTIEGEERDENLNFTKHYVNAHIVNYEGKRVNKERIEGCWSLPVDTIDDWSRGQFLLKKVAIDEEHQGSFLRLNVIDWLEKISGLNTLRNWKGFYEQDDENHDMETCFVFTPSGKIHGKGNDSIGFYTWCGNLSSHEDGTKKVNLIKQYFGRHAVCYNGEMYEPEPGELVMEGTWNISFCCGAFRLQMACLSSGQVQRQWTFGQVHQWTGYWIQESRKGPMDLELFITYDHQVLGSGEDEVGKFTIEGASNEFKLHKALCECAHS